MSDQVTSIPELPGREVVEIHWPMSIPANSKYAISSPHPLILSCPSAPSDFKLHIHTPTPIDIWAENHPIAITPAGPPTPGFAAGWSRLPNELKFAILRHFLLYQSSLWPANTNPVIRRSLFPYLRMTPNIAKLSRSIFFQENLFVISFPGLGSTLQATSMPPLSVRPLLRRVEVVTSLAERDWRTLRLIAQRNMGFENIRYLQVRCRPEDLAQEYDGRILLQGGVLNESLEGFLHRRFEQPVRFPFWGEVVFDLSGMVGWALDEAAWMRMRFIEGVVREKISFARCF